MKPDKVILTITNKDIMLYGLEKAKATIVTYDSDKYQGLGLEKTIGEMLLKNPRLLGKLLLANKEALGITLEDKRKL